jgi:hypothetical protein
MRKVLVPVFALTLATSSFAQEQKPAPIVMAASSFATVEVHINSRPIGKDWYGEDAGLTGPARIAISYGQPHARGRVVEGNLIPTDTVWRFGANTATTLHTDVDIMIGNLSLKRGDYSLYIMRSANGAQLIVNRQTGHWGTDYDASQDIGRVALTSRALAEPEGTLTIHLIPESAAPRRGYAELRGMLHIKWGKTEWSAPFQVVK